MAPGIISDIPVHSESVQNGNGVHAKSSYREPLKPSGALEQFAWEDATPVIGREFPTLNIVDDLLNATNADELLRDLAITSKSIMIMEKHNRHQRVLQSHSEVLSSSVHRITSRTIFKRNLSISSVNSPESPSLPLYTFTRF